MPMTVKGTGAPSSKLHRLARNIEDGNWHDDVERTVIEHERQTFATEGTSAGTPWKPLSAPYSRRKVRAGRRDLLVVSGSLRASLTGGTLWKSEKVSPDHLRLGSRHPLAHLHQRGTKGKQLPARPVLVVTRSLRREIRDAVKRSLLGS